MSSRFAPLLLAASLTARTPPAVEAPLAERLQWNARERTATGIRALAAGDSASAIEAFDRARRLRAADLRTTFNAGTARIADDAAGAAALLAEAARAASPELAPAAWYNLGTARLAAGDADGAAEALRETLRRAPDHADAKHNLELALRELDRQRPKEKAESPSSPGEGESRREQARRGEGGEKGEAGEPQEPSAPDEPDDRGETSQHDADAAPASGSAPSAGRRPLPQFRDLPDMTAEQAAAILRAVEDLERQQRRERARRAAEQRARVEIDW
ncbi:MAG TPA: hypothetical protein VGC00_08020 [Thermoanaerobaculia bacterium]